MMRVDDLLQTKHEEILEVAAKHGARNVRVFGSAACGEADERSDIDLLVDLEPDRSLLDLGGLSADLNVLPVQVDVVTEKSLRDSIRERLLKKAVPP